MTGCHRLREVVEKPAVARNAPECGRPKNIDHFILVFVLITGRNVLHRCPSPRLAVILCPKRCRTVQSIFHNLTQMQLKMSIKAGR